MPRCTGRVCLAVLLLTPLVASAQFAPVVCYAPPPVVSYYAPAPAVSYYAPAPVVSYYPPAPVVSYYAPPAVTTAYYQAPATVYRPVTVDTYRYGLFGRRRTDVVTYGSPAFVPGPVVGVRSYYYPPAVSYYP